MKFLTEAGRLEAFSDGVIAVIITIMVLELKPPAGAGPHALIDVLPGFGIYALSFVYIGIYWNNHHHLLRASRGIDGRVMWANLNLLFWLSLVPFGTAWVGRYPFAPYPTLLYSLMMFLAAVAYALLERALVDANKHNAALARALTTSKKGRLSILLYLLAVVASLFFPWVAICLLVIVAIMWFAPDRRLEPVITHTSSEDTQ